MTASLARPRCETWTASESHRAWRPTPDPTVILNGALDVLFRLTAGGFAGVARDVRRVRLRGATHLANLDPPAAFSVAIRRFMEGLGEAT